MIVVDTNIIGYLYLTGDRSAQAEKALLKDPVKMKNMSEFARRLAIPDAAEKLLKEIHGTVSL